MKNKHFEHRREAAKRFKNSPNNGFARRMVNGVAIYHDYTEPRKLSFWDDFGFILGSQYVLVTWVHPRMAFSDAVEAEAEENVIQAIGPGPIWDFFKNNTPVYKKVGKSRKKINSFSLAMVPADYEEYRLKVNIETDRLLKESSLTAKPSIRIMQWHTCRQVAIVYPAELLNVSDIVVFAAMLKQHLLGRGDMFAHLDGYRYGAADWQTEEGIRND